MVRRVRVQRLRPEDQDGEYKWVIALDAIATLLATYSDTIHFGLSFFPRDADVVECEVE